MDTLTHALSGALLARATAPKEPDLDFVYAFFGPVERTGESGRVPLD